ELRAELERAGYRFQSDTDTEVIGHMVHSALAAGMDLLAAVQAATARLRGAYAIAVLDREEPDRVVGTRRGSPLCIGFGIGEHFLGADVQALIKVTHRFAYLEEGDVVEITRDGVRVLDADGQPAERAVLESEFSADAVERGEYRHYMLKEIFEQPAAIA